MLSRGGVGGRLLRRRLLDALLALLYCDAVRLESDIQEFANLGEEACHCW
jgi:hypothetical protein